jgi:hypothetical protein
MRRDFVRRAGVLIGVCGGGVWRAAVSDRADAVFGDGHFVAVHLGVAERMGWEGHLASWCGGSEFPLTPTLSLGEKEKGVGGFCKRRWRGSESPSPQPSPWGRGGTYYLIGVGFLCSSRCGAGTPAFPARRLLGARASRSHAIRAVVLGNPVGKCARQKTYPYKL